ncbi:MULTISPECIES: hypothetical protein [unclassified Mycoplasma]|uniref:hypothetical protein n=1 Tax=unclassified Mycoplasma TaxID=2683645 RepID=UPI002B1DA842|nr:MULTISPECIES: hypothetical protein [unclassified Mycoplasma]MEA4134274.1 hypothetical protein [Mycoplasma sp. 2704]MEA4190910.1 hypothetical protein [Mycoplasma sp. 2248]MEA4276166.1 hypothetical protein [Mycoplasma sp. 21DD0573]
MQKKFLSVPILVLWILDWILIFILSILAVAGALTGAGVGFVIGMALVYLLVSGMSLALFIMQIVAAVRINSENKTIMVLYIVGFFVPICTLIAASMAIYKKLY